MSPAVAFASVALAEGTTGPTNATDPATTVSATMSVLRNIINLPGSPNRALGALGWERPLGRPKICASHAADREERLERCACEGQPDQPGPDPAAHHDSTALVTLGGRNSGGRRPS